MILRVGNMLMETSLVFPRWDMVSVEYGILRDKAHFSQVTVILCVFLLSYVYGEGKVMDFGRSY